MDIRDTEHLAEQAPWAGRNEVYLPHDPVQLEHFRKGPQPPKPDAYENLPFMPLHWLLFAVVIGGFAWFFIYSAGAWLLNR